jgi:exodeoxyribonuclease VII small subunit
VSEEAQAHRPASELSYAEATRELEEIVQFFEAHEVDVDELVPRLERATELVEELDRRIRKTRASVDELLPRLDSALADDAADPHPGT